MLVLMTAKVMT